MSSRQPLALTRGDPSGVGLEIAFQAWRARRSEPVAPFILIADLDHCRRTAEAIGLEVSLAVCEPAQAAALFDDVLPVLPLGVTTHGEPGAPDPADAPGTIASMERAVELVAHGRASAVVTLPVSKEILHKAGFRHPGQTEFMGEMATRLYGASRAPVMLIWSETLAVVPVTIHIPIADVPTRLTEDLIVTTIETVAADYRARFGVANPRIAVTGLNPHAGEGGDIGREDIEIVAPALARLRRAGIGVSGPHPADTMFHAKARATYDVAVTMYHDQGLIPVKTLAFDTGVNTTLGLPFVRTSPDHGTAFDIAGRGIANPASLIAALNLAARLADADALGSAPRHDRARMIDALPPLRDVVATHGLEAKKSLGQNFIFDLNLTSRIARGAGPIEGTCVVEIGPGPGGLTRALLAAGANVVAIERDERCLAALDEVAAHYPGRLRVLQQDALATDYAALAATYGAKRICANLPYNIATPLLIGWLQSEPWPPWFDRLVLMFQREVAERIVAGPAERAAYGRLGVLANWRCTTRILFDVPRQSFVPPPNVTSSVVELVSRANPVPCDPLALAAVTQAAFGQRRKMLRQSLKSLGVDPMSLLAEAGLEETRRAEEIPVDGFVALARALVAARRP